MTCAKLCRNQSWNEVELKHKYRKYVLFIRIFFKQKNLLIIDQISLKNAKLCGNKRWERSRIETYTRNMCFSLGFFVKESKKSIKNLPNMYDKC